MSRKTIDQEREESEALFYTDEEIRSQLGALGYDTIPNYQLRLFREDLEHLLLFEQSKSTKSEALPPESEAVMEGRKGGGDELKEEAEKPKKEAKEPESTSSEPKKTPVRPKLEPKFVDGPPLEKSKSERPRSHSPVSSESSWASSIHPYRWHKRKVLRHIDGEPVVTDESHTDAESDVSCITDRFSSLFMDDDDGLKNERIPSWGADCPLLYSVLKNKSKQSSTISKMGHKSLTRSDYYDEIVRYLPKSFMSGNIYKPLKKTDPRDRYQMYRNVWSQFRIPGETQDRELRWCIRALLLSSRGPDSQEHAIRKKEAVHHAKKLREAREWQF